MISDYRLKAVMENILFINFYFPNYGDGNYFNL